MLGRCAQPTLCHPKLTRKLVELAKRNFLFLLGVSGSQKQMLKQVLDFVILRSLTFALNDIADILCYY